MMSNDKDKNRPHFCKHANVGRFQGIPSLLLLYSMFRKYFSTPSIECRLQLVIQSFRIGVCHLFVSDSFIFFVMNFGQTKLTAWWHHSSQSIKLPSSVLSQRGKTTKLIQILAKRRDTPCRNFSSVVRFPAVVGDNKQYLSPKHFLLCRTCSSLLSQSFCVTCSSLCASSKQLVNSC